MILPAYARLCEGGPQSKVTQFADMSYLAPVNTLMTQGTYNFIRFSCRKSLKTYMKAQSCLFKPLMPHLSGRKIETDADIHNEEHC